MANSNLANERRKTQPSLPFPLQPKDHNDSLLAKVRGDDDSSISSTEEETKT